MTSTVAAGFQGGGGLTQTSDGKHSLARQSSIQNAKTYMYTPLCSTFLDVLHVLV